MLIEVHYGDSCVLLVNGNCRAIHVLNYIRNRCGLSSSTKLDLCLLNSGEPFHLSSLASKFISSERNHLPLHVHCVLTLIDKEGTYSPLLNDSTLITSDFLAKLNRATDTKVTSKSISKSGKQSPDPIGKEVKGRRSLKSVAIASTVMSKLSQ